MQDSIERTKQYIAVMQAFAEGKQVEINNVNYNAWNLLQVPAWDFLHNKYRVKRVPKEFYAAVFPGGRVGSFCSDAAEFVKNYGRYFPMDARPQIKKFVEVID